MILGNVGEWHKALSEHRVSWQMADKILKRIETKLDIIIGLLQDRALTAEEVALLRETDEIVRKMEYRKLAKL